MTIVRWIMLGLGTALLASGCVGDDPPEHLQHQVIRPQAIMGGTIDHNDTAVVGIIAADGYAGGICTGSLIAPNLVLTAQHCIAEVSSQQVRCGETAFGEKKSIYGIMVTTDTVMSRNSSFHQTAKLHVPPGGNDMCGHDIALIELRQNLSVEPLVPRIDIPPQKDEAYRAVGYGVDGNDQQTAGTRRMIDNRSVFCDGPTCPAYQQIGGYTVPIQVTDTEWVGSEGTCQGDSGGPAIDEQGRVLGALSRGVYGCQSSTYSSVHGWKDWILEKARGAADRGDYVPPQWVELGVSEIPEDDQDVDGVKDDQDNCPDVANEDQADSDDDGIGDACDVDGDNDGVNDQDDNCPNVANEGQSDIDGDGDGDACDADIDDDGWENEADACPEDPNWSNFGDPCGTDPAEAEVNIVSGSEDDGCSVASADSPEDALGSITLVALLFGLLGIRRRW